MLSVLVFLIRQIALSVTNLRLGVSVIGSSLLSRAPEEDNIKGLSEPPLLSSRQRPSAEVSRAPSPRSNILSLSQNIVSTISPVEYKTSHTSIPQSPFQITTSLTKPRATRERSNMPIPTHPLPPIDPTLLVSIIENSSKYLHVVRTWNKPPLTDEKPWVIRA